VWVEAVLLTEDLDRLVAQFAPLTIALGAGRLHLSDPEPCVLVPEVGVWVVCRAKVHWPVLGIDVPVTLHSLAVLLRPQVVAGESGEALAVTLEIESMDLAGGPKMLDDRITAMANKELIRKEVELSWCFSRTLTHSFPLPESITPLESLDLTVLAGRVRIRSDGIGLAVKLDSAVKRHAVDPGAADETS
jgi:hypothetical protein